MVITAFFLTVLAIALVMLIVFLAIGSVYMARALVGEISATRRLRKMAREYAAAPVVVDDGARLEDDLK